MRAQQEARGGHRHGEQLPGNNYLKGNYAPLRREHTITELAVTGTIPAHLDGRYLRNGPNPVAEFLFVPTAPQAGEDDGVLMGFVYDASTDRSDLTILDAASLEAIAAIHLPERVPYGFHGNWAPTAAPPG